MGYFIKLEWQDGRVQEIGHSYDPVATLQVSHGIAKSPRVIKRIEFHDNQGALEILWDANWSA